MILFICLPAKPLQPETLLSIVNEKKKKKNNYFNDLLHELSNMMTRSSYYDVIIARFI